MAGRPSLRTLRTRLTGPAATEQVWALALEVTTLGGTILAFMLLGRSLGAEGYGAYATLYAIIGPVVTLAASGVVLAQLQHSVAEGESLAGTARSCLSIVLVLGSVLTVLSCAISFAIVDGLGPVAIVSIVAIELLTTPIVLVAATTEQAGTSFAGAARIRLLLVAGRAVAVIALFLAGALTVANLGVAHLVWSLVLGVYMLRRIGRRYGFRLVPGRIERSHVRTNFVFSTAISADAVGNDGDKVVLAANGFVTDTGLYAAAYRVIQLGLIPLGALANTTHVRFLERSRVPGYHLRLAMRYSGIALAYGIAFGLAVIVAAPLLPIVVGSSFEDSVEIVRWLAPIVALRGLGMYSLNALLGLRRTGLRTGIVVANAAFGVVLYLTLIPSRGWRGAMAATLITEALQVIMTWTALVICQRRADREEASVVAEADPDGPEHPTGAAEDLGDPVAPPPAPPA